MSALQTQTSDPYATHSRARYKNRRAWRIYIFLALLLSLAIWGIVSRSVAHSDVARRTEREAIPIVSVVQPKPGEGTVDLILPGEISPWFDAPVYARTSGYVESWSADIGDVVKQGQILAHIESPEVDQQLAQGQADLVQAQANEKLADVTAKRWIDLLKTDSVSQQDTDEKIGSQLAMRAAREAAEANVRRLKQLQEFEDVRAPFDGVITQRNTDIGALINAGNTAGQQLFRIAATSRLRVYVSVPETYAEEMKPGLSITLRVTEHPDKTYPAKLLSTANAINLGTRTLQVELVADNKDGALYSGAYTEVHFALPPNRNSFRIPVNTLLFRADGMTVATVDPDNHIAIKPITIGRDYGNDVEVIAGLTQDDKLVLNVPDGIADKEQVRVEDEAQKEKDDQKAHSEDQDKKSKKDDSSDRKKSGPPGDQDKSGELNAPSGDGKNKSGEQGSSSGGSGGANQGSQTLAAPFRKSGLDTNSRGADTGGLSNAGNGTDASDYPQPQPKNEDSPDTGKSQDKAGDQPKKSGDDQQ